MVSGLGSARHSGAARIEGEGTPERVWWPWLEAQDWPVLDVEGLLGGDRPLVVVAAHPDDEVLAVGGLLSLAARSGCRPLVLWATDGEASHPTSSAIEPDDLRRRRPAESAVALELLGVRHRSLRLALPDGAVAAHEETVAAAVASVAEAGGVVVAPWRGDAHPDHDACGRAAATATAAAGALLVEYPVWAWHWAAPADSRLPWSSARRVELGPDVVAAKARAIEAFETQVRDLGPRPEDAAVLTPAMLARWSRPYEVVFVPGGAS